MLFGYSPFKPRNDNNNIIRNIKHANYSFPENIKVSDEAKDFIRRLLTLKPEQRLGFRGATEIQLHPFFKSINLEDLYNKKLEAPIKVKLLNRKRKEIDFPKTIEETMTNINVPDFTYANNEIIKDKQ